MSRSAGPTMLTLWAIRDARHPELDRNDIAVLDAVVKFMGADGWSRPGAKRIAVTQRMGVSTVKASMSKLRACGILVRGSGGGGDEAAPYRIDIARLEPRPDSGRLPSSSARGSVHAPDPTSPAVGPHQSSSRTPTRPATGPFEDLVRIGEDHEDQIPQTPKGGLDKNPTTSRSPGSHDPTPASHGAPVPSPAPMPTSAATLPQDAPFALTPPEPTPSPTKARRGGKAAQYGATLPAESKPAKREDAIVASGKRYLAALDEGIGKAFGRPHMSLFSRPIYDTMVAIARTFAKRKDGTLLGGEELIAWFVERGEAFGKHADEAQVRYQGGFGSKGFLWWLNNGCPGEPVYVHRAPPRPVVEPRYRERLAQPGQPEQAIAVWQAIVDLEEELGHEVSIPDFRPIALWWTKIIDRNDWRTGLQELHDRLRTLYADGVIKRRTEVAA